MTRESQFTHLGLFDARVPRYTSYPSAPHFVEGVTSETFSDWIEAIPAHSEISLYLHIPFCRRLCWFCACRTQGTSSDTPVISYVETLKSELRLLKKRLAPGIKLAHLHWGGGTPTMLKASQISDLAATVFDITPMAAGGEFSVEIDPNEIDESRLNALNAAIMNRASIGVQDFDPKIQKTIGREQPYEVTRRVIEMIRERGITSLNADIIYGLPHQTRSHIADSVQKLLTLSPDRVAVYGYAHVPWISRRQQIIPSDTIPTPKERLSLFETARELFVWDGYQEIGIDHFARPDDKMAIAQRTGHLRRNFQGYTTDTTPILIGLGASSISRFPQGYAQNVSGTSDYTKAVRAGHFATHRGHFFTGEDTLRARIIEALMCDFHVSRAELLRDFSTTPDHIENLLANAAGAFNNMVRLDVNGLTILPQGKPLTRIIARAFDAYDQTKAQHSTAV